MADINDWVDDPTPAAASAAAPAAAPSAKAPAAQDISDWVDDAPAPKSFSDRISEDKTRIGDEAVNKLQNPNLNDLGRAAIDANTGMNTMWSYPKEGVVSAYNALPDNVRNTISGAADSTKQAVLESWNKLPAESRNRISSDVGALRDWIGGIAYEHPNITGVAGTAASVAPIAPAVSGIAKIPGAIGDAMKGTEGLADLFAKKYPNGGPFDPIPSAGAPVPKDVAAFNAQKGRNVGYVEGMNANAENMKNSFGQIYDKAGEISSGVTMKAPRMKNSVDDLVENLNEDTAHKTSQGSSQAFRDLQAVADSFDDEGNIPLDKVTLLKKRLNDLYSSDMGETRGKIYAQLNDQLNNLIKRAKVDNPEWGKIMDSGNALFNNYRSTFDSPGLSNKSWSLGDKKEYEDAFRARHGDQANGMPGDPFSAPPSDETRAKMMNVHNVDNVAQFESMVRKLPPEMRDQFTQDVISASKEKNPRLASAIRSAYSAAQQNYGTAIKNAAKALMPGDPGFNPAMAEQFPHVEDAITYHTKAADTAHQQYMDKLYGAQNPPAPLGLPAPATRMPGPGNYNDTMYPKLPAPNPADPIYPKVPGPNGTVRDMTQQELENHIAQQQKMFQQMTPAERSAIQNRAATTEADRLARAKAAHQQNPLNQSNMAPMANQPIGIDEGRQAIRDRDAPLFDQSQTPKMPSVKDMATEERHPEDVGDVGRALLKSLGFARGGAAYHKVVDSDPTEAQKAAGNYKKAHVRFHGLDISIENPRGSYRSGVGKDGKTWKAMMPDHYGYIKRTTGADGDHVDVYLGDNDKSNRVYVIDQKDSDTGKFDEHKCMLGYGDRDAAVRAYKLAFSDKKDRIMKVTRMSIEEFKGWLKNGNTKQPIKKAA